VPQTPNPPQRATSAKQPADDSTPREPTGQAAASPRGRRSIAFRITAVFLGIILGLICCEGVLRVLVAAEFLKADAGFGAFVRHLRDAQTIGYAVLWQYEAASFGGRPPGLFRRVNDTRLGWEPVAGVQAGEIRINSGGFRGPEYALSPPAGVHRIALLGDSETFGMSLRESETLAGCLEAQLRSLKPDGSFEVLNFGVPGYNTQQEAARLESRVLQYNPEMVVLLYCFNDPEISTRNVIVGDGWWSRTYLELLVVFLRRSTDTFDQMQTSSHSISEYYLRLHASPYFEQTKATLRKMSDGLAQKGIPMILIIGTELAGYDDLRGGYPYESIHKALAALESKSLTVVDPKPLLAAESADPKSFWVKPYDTHKNERANKIMATRVAEEILRRGKP
jgi:lysophospholipase L1-like esterase